VPPPLESRPRSVQYGGPPHEGDPHLSPPYREHLERLEWATRWLDRRYLDPLLGALLPGAGDVLGAALGLYAIVVAWRMRVHPLVIARMFLHLGLDALLGAIPLFGDVSDIFYRAHERNLALLKTRNEREARASDWLIVIAAGAAFLFALCLPALLIYGLWRGFAVERYSAP
jgi:Domain of unknown function (DUF4112)